MYDPIIKKRDPITLAEHLTWAAAHWKEDNHQPRDLDELMIESAAALRQMVPRFWTYIAAIQGLVLISVPYWR
jgi:hypothetical protein